MAKRGFFPFFFRFGGIGRACISTPPGYVNRGEWDFPKSPDLKMK